MSRRTFLEFGGLILLAAAVVRLFRLDHFSYGLDEVLQGFWIRGSWEFFWRSLRFDAVHPPLDYLIARAVEQLEPLGWQRKLPAVLWGLATVGTLGMLVARRAGRAAGLFTGLLLAFAPFHVRYSQEFRPHALGLFMLCLSLLALDRFLGRPGFGRLASLFLVCIATAYALYLAAFILALAATALLIEDALSDEEGRRRSARRFLAWSPLFVAALWLAYLPWWPVVLEAARRPPPVPAEPLTWSRLGRTLSFFTFASDDGAPFGWPAAFGISLSLWGAVAAARERKLRFLLVWCFGGTVAVEVLGQVHPHWYHSRRFLAAGVVLPLLAGVGISRFLKTKSARLVGTAILVVVLTLDGRGLARYFGDGRADWRPLASFLASKPPTEQIFTENQYAQLCIAYYLCGPDWLSRGAGGYRPVSNLECEPVRLTWSWPGGATAWLVQAGEPKCRALREWAGSFAATPFPTAEGAVLFRLDPALRDAALGLKR